MQAARRGIGVGLVEVLCVLAALGALSASVIWDVSFSGIVALIVVIVLYAVLRDVRMLWHMGKSGMSPASADKDCPVHLQTVDGTNERIRTTIE